jgi:hypothetical protein
MLMPSKWYGLAYEIQWHHHITQRHNSEIMNKLLYNAAGIDQNYQQNFRKKSYYLIIVIQPRLAFATAAFYTHIIAILAITTGTSSSFIYTTLHYHQHDCVTKFSHHQYNIIYYCATKS